LKDRIEHGLLRAVEAGVARLPHGAAVRLGEGLGALARWPLGIRRGTVEDNLRRAFPDEDRAWRETVIRSSYRHLGREAIEMIRLSYLSREEIVERTVIPERDWAEFQAARAEGRGVLLITGHYGNWEVAAAALAARGIPIGAIVKRMRNPLVDRRLEEARARLGIDTIEMRTASKRVPRLLAEGGVIGIVADQDARGKGVWVPFFGVPSSTFRGPALFALRLAAPAFAAVAARLPDGRYRVSGERVEYEPTGDLERDVVALTTRFAAHLERAVRQDPGQYFWFHRRWKSAPPAELPAAATGITRDAGGTKQGPTARSLEP
jgi:KDO2-lipid IV(A) lauroyltransferase